jgi:hypothetical protein
LLGEDEDGLVTDGAADEFPGFGCAIYSAFADSFWAAAAESAALVTARLSSGAVDLPLCFGVGSSTEGGGGLLVKIVLLRCLIGALVVRTIPWIASSSRWTEFLAGEAVTKSITQ